MATINLRYYRQIAADCAKSGQTETAYNYEQLIAEIEQLQQKVADLVTEKFHAAN